MIHNFTQSLAAANSPDAEVFLEECYRAFFPHMVGSIKNSRNNLGQHLGIDRVLFLNNGNTIRCEEKIRARDYGDFLLEHSHVTPDGKPYADGWVQKDLLTDFFVYAVPSAAIFWAIPWALLKGAWLANASRWKQRAPKIADNGKYKTISYAVTLEELKRALVEQMFFRNPAQS